MAKNLLILLFAASTVASANAQVPILAYHQVEAVPKMGWSVSREDFQNQMEYLSAAGYHVISIAALYDYLSGKTSSIPEKPVVITVDDGFVDAYTEIFPILKRYRYPWSLYVYPRFVDHGADALRWSQVAELAAAGVDIQSHTVNHPHLMRKSHPEMDDEQYAAWLHTELADSKTIIEEKTKTPVRFLAYPYGDFDSGVEEEAARAGYQLALTSWAGFNTTSTNRFELWRFPMTSDTTIAAFARGLGAVPLPVNEPTPAPDSVARPTAITATVANPAEIDPSSIRMVLLGQSVDSTYDPETGTVTAKLPTLKRSQQTVVVLAERAADRQPMSASWTFYTTDKAKADYEERSRKLRELPLHHTETVRH